MGDEHPVLERDAETSHIAQLLVQLEDELQGLFPEGDCVTDDWVALGARIVPSPAGCSAAGWAKANRLGCLRGGDCMAHDVAPSAARILALRSAVEG